MDKIQKEQVKSNLIKTSIPTILSFILANIFSIVDTMLIGTIKDEKTYTASLSAINITSRIMLFVSALSRGINVASSTIISRYLGNNDKEKMQSILLHTILLNVFIISIPLVIISLIFIKPIMLFIGNNYIIYEIGKGYYISIMVGFIFSSFNNVMAFLIRAVGESKRSLKLEIFSNSFNIIGDILLINGIWIFPKLEVTGAGVATLIYLVILSICYLYVLLRSNSRLRLNFEYKFKLDKKLLKDMLQIGIPASTELISIRGANIIFTKIVATLGTTVLAAQQICMNIFNLIIEIGNALSVSVAPLVSKSIGEKKENIAKLYIKESKKISLILSTIIGIIILLFSNMILDLYTDSESVKEIVKTTLVVIIVTQYAQNIRDIYAGGLRGIGDTKYIAKYTIIIDAILKIILAYILVDLLKLNLVSVWMIILGIEILKAIIFNKRFYSEKWKNIKTMKEGI